MSPAHRPPLLALATLTLTLAILAVLSPLGTAGEMTAIAAEEAAEAPPGLSLHVGVLGLAPREAPGSQILRLRIEGEAPPGPWMATISVPGRQSVTAPCGDLAGREFFEVAVPGVEKECDVGLRLECGPAVAASSVRLRPLRPWTVHIVQHTHTDMGYTDYPTRLAADHVDFIEEALVACKHTDELPDDAKFRWTCEATWAVDRFVDGRGASLLDRLLDRIREGRIEVTAMSMNMTDLATEEGVVRSFYPLARLRKLGIPVRSGMQCDVNGYPWALPELLQDAGITGFAGSINVTRSTLPFDFPRAIRWESPSGGSVLAWRGEHYMQANFLGFGDSAEQVISKLPPYLSSLAERGYPYDAVLLQMAGYFTDNAAPSYRVCALVKDWNERFAIPRIRVSTLSDYFDALGEDPDAPAMRKAWPDWWADGVGSSALETAIIRDAQERLGFAETFLALATVDEAGPPARGRRIPAVYPRQAIEEAFLAARLYDEHTWGAAESIDRPNTINTKVQWAEKSMNAYRTRALATDLESAALNAWATSLIASGEPGIVVFNALSWPRSDAVRVRLPRMIAEEGTPFRLLDAETGAEVPYQLGAHARNYREVELVARDVPALGYRAFRIAVGQDPTEPDDPFRVDGNEISNGIVTVVLDPARACIASIVPAAGGESDANSQNSQNRQNRQNRQNSQSSQNDQNIVDAESEHGFNRLVYERIVHERGRWVLWPPPTPYDPKAFTVTLAEEAKVSPGSPGPARRSLILAAKLAIPEGTLDVETEVSLYRGLPGVHIENRVRKPEVFDAEGCYFAFPFSAGTPPRADLVGGVMVPGTDQIPRSADDWHCIQRWVRLAAPGRNAVWVTRDAPLIQFGGLNTGRYGRGLNLDRSLFYSWPMNNYWFTNFLATQRGDFVFRYVVAGGAAASSDAAANRFGREACAALVGAAAEGRATGPAPSASFLRVEPAELSLVGVKLAEEGRGLVVRVRNYSPSAANAVIAPMLRTPPTSAERTSILEEVREELPLDGGGARLRIGPWALETVVFRW